MGISPSLFRSPVPARRFDLRVGAYDRVGTGAGTRVREVDSEGLGLLGWTDLPDVPPAGVNQGFTLRATVADLGCVCRRFAARTRVVTPGDRMLIPVSKLSDHPVAESALHELCKPFVPADRAFDPRCEVVQPDGIPYPEDQLLVHHDHMTEVLEKHHGAPVTVRVLAEVVDGDVYTRQIVLAPVDRPGMPVEWGIARLDLRYLSPDVKDEILSKRLPLGAVLIKHDVLRRVKPRWFFRFPDGGPVLSLFGKLPHPGPVYGRVGTIYCDGEPAIEVMEVVLNTGAVGSRQ